MLAAIPGASIDARSEMPETLTLIGYVLLSTGMPAEAEPEFCEANRNNL
jgi:hypothetical protein